MPDSYTTRRDADFTAGAARFDTNTGLRVLIDLHDPARADHAHVITERADGRRTTLWYAAENGQLIEVAVTIAADHPVVSTRHNVGVGADDAIAELRRGVPETVLRARLGI